MSDPIVLQKALIVQLVAKLRCLFAALILLVGVFFAQAQPTLHIAPAGDHSVLYYSATSTNYILQSRTNLTSTNWVTAADSVMVTAATVSNAAPAEFFRLLYTDPPAGMALIPAGSFTIGNSIGDSDIADAIPTNIYVSAFYMDINLVTLSLWQTVQTYAIGAGYSFSNAGSGKATNHPVQTVNWFDCVKWCNARSQPAELIPVYYTDAGMTQVFTNGDSGTTVFANWKATGYRLPTEAEWEKAARGGLQGRRFPWGNLISANQANYVANTATNFDLGPNGTNATGLISGYPFTSPVGSFDVNGYGLYDMAGNLFQWCWDWYGAPPYALGSAYFGGTDPRGASTGVRRVERGGSWAFGGATGARSAARNFFNPASTTNNIGFRCVKGL